LGETAELERMPSTSTRSRSVCFALSKRRGER